MTGGEHGVDDERPRSAGEIGAGERRLRRCRASGAFRLDGVAPTSSITT